MSRVRVAIDQPLKPGNYEIVGVVERGNPETLTTQQLNESVKNRYGDQVTVLDYKVNGREVRLLVKVSQSDAITAQGISLLITAVAIVSVGFFLWRVSVNTKEAFKVASETITENPALGAGVAGFGVGIALIGGAVLVMALSSTNRKEQT